MTLLGKSVRSYIHRLYPYVTPDSSVGELRRLVRELRVRVIPVVRDELSMKFMGLVKRSALLMVSSTRAAITAKDLMEDPKTTALEDENLADVLRRLVEVDEWYAPVLTQDGRYLGIVGLEAGLMEMLSSGSRVLESPVDYYMSTDLVFVEPDTPVYRVWQMMLSRRLAALPVVRRGRIVGVIAEHDLVARGYTRPDLEAEGLRAGPRVREVMHTPPITVELGTPMKRAVELMLLRDIGRVYVVERGNVLRGVVDRSDAIAAWLGMRRPRVAMEAAG
ncbi:MAG: CBS domain-containing protein [Thermoproteota archaeon]